MISRFTKIIAAFSTVLLLYSCGSSKNQIDGKGPVQEKEIPIEKNFEGVNIKGGWEITLVEARENKMVVKTNENLFKQLEHSVKKNILSVGTSKNIHRADAKEIILYHTEELETLIVSSGSQLSSNDKLKPRNLSLQSNSGAKIELRLKTKNLAITASGGSNIELSGKSKSVTANASGGSNVDAKHLKVDVASLEASAGGEIGMEVTDELTAKATSGGSIQYYGNPKHNSLNRSSSGTIDQK